MGKSTLLNQLLKQKIAIVSDKPQTTRNKILGIYSEERGQIIFLDTPGIHKPRHKLGEYLVALARSTLKEVDLILYLVDVSVPVGAGEHYVLELLRPVETPVLLVLNKIDLVSEVEIRKVQTELEGNFSFARAVSVSALQGKNLASLVSAVFDFLPAGPQYYPLEMITDQPETFLVAELVREKILLLTREEVPHTVAVVVDEFTPRRRDLIYIRALIYVEKESQKGILIGGSGQMLKEIGRLAREEIEVLLGVRIYLELSVKVKKDWRKEERTLRSLGYTLPK